jgi:EAL domain-containing protein (putative c-di-GMP-specific phosphodiesterase class I)
MDASLDRIALPAGTLLFAEGDSGTAAFLIVSGCLEIFLPRDGLEIVLASRGAGEIVGEMAILDSRSRSASARAVVDCELVIVTANQIKHRIAETDPVLRMFLGVVIARYREMVGMIDSGDRRQTPRSLIARDDEFEASVGALSMESELRRSLRGDEFELFFQPIVRLSSQRLAGFEALLRWRHPTRGLIAPSDFIPIAEASGLIVEITAWCLKAVGVAFPEILAASLSNAGAVEPLFLSVNISGHDLSRAAFVGSLAEMLESSGLAPESIKLEVTESVLMKDPKTAIEALEACRKLGVSIALDDFGAGYSSLSYLSTLPITTLKIDRSFVRSMINSPASRKIIQTILRLADELEILVVAEGIEDTEEAWLLSNLGCAFAQGYLFGKPMPLAQALDVTRSWRPFDTHASPKAARMAKRARA